MTLRVANWSEHFENNRTRELKVMTWVPVPTKQDGDGYTQVMDHPQGAAHFGAWIAMLQVAAKCDERGTLVREGRSGVRVPHDAASLSRLTRIPARILSDAIARLVEIGWLEDDAEEEPVTLLESACRQEGATASQEGAGIPQDAAPSRARAVGQNKTEQEKRRSSSSSAPRGADRASPTSTGSGPSTPEGRQARRRARLGCPQRQAARHRNHPRRARPGEALLAVDTRRRPVHPAPGDVAATGAVGGLRHRSAARPLPRLRQAPEPRPDRCHQGGPRQALLRGAT